MTPDKYTIESLMLDVGDGHQLYVQDWGNKKSKSPIVFLHGGPGGGVSDSHKQSFDPYVHRVLFFDQRGSGQSLPYGSLDSNTTEHLINDITKIADRFNLDTFVLTGGSWGSTLALLYGIKHPHRVQRMVLRGIFTATKAEHDWITKGGYSAFFPDVLEDFINNTPEEHRHNPDDYHFKRILGNDLGESVESSLTMGKVEGSLLSLDDRYKAPPTKDYDPTFMRIETHYIANNCFIDDGYILNNTDKLTMPIWLIQGRYDMVCPPINAWNLHKKLPYSKLTWTMAGHGNERSNYDVYSTIFANLGDE
jgi:proline iminopeptidase